MRSSVRIRGIAVAAALSLATVGAACATLGRAVFEEPVVTFRNLRVNGIGLDGGSLDVVLGVGVYVLSTFANRATRAEIDAPFAPFVWKRD